MYTELVFVYRDCRNEKVKGISAGCKAVLDITKYPGVDVATQAWNNIAHEEGWTAVDVDLLAIFQNEEYLKNYRIFDSKTGKILERYFP